MSINFPTIPLPTQVMLAFVVGIALGAVLGAVLGFLVARTIR